MQAENPYLTIAQTYTAGVRELFAPAGAPTGDRGGAGPASPEALAEKAEKLSTVSATLTTTAAARLTLDDDPVARAQASTQLLAKAMTDLEISNYLLKAAEDEKAQISWPKSAVQERSVAIRGNLEDFLKIIVEETPAAKEQSDRGGDVPKRVEIVRNQLLQTVDGALLLIPERAGKTGQSAFSGLLGLGITQVGQAAGQLGLGVAHIIGQTEKLSRLYQLFRDFAVRAYESVAALLGPTLAQIAGQKVVDWLGQVKEAKFFNGLLEKLYQTEQTKADLRQRITNSTSDWKDYVTADEKIQGLNEEFRRQLSLIDKLLKGLKYLGGVPAAILPYGPLLMAAVYILLCAYVVFTGADYLDAQNLKFLNRVLGVRQVVETTLAI